jgi:hypothetical protein
MGNSNSQKENNTSNIYNVIPDAPDIRDIHYNVSVIDKKIQLQKEIKNANELNIEVEQEKHETSRPLEQVFKNHVDLRANIDVLPIYMFSMEEIGTSIVCAICSIIYAKLTTKNNTLFCPSRCFILYNTFVKNGIMPSLNLPTDNENDKEIDNNTLIKCSNQKMNIRDHLKALKQYGICDEKNYACNIETMKNKPSDYCYNEGRYLQFNYKKVKNGIEYIKYLLSNDEIILCNLSVYASFMDNDTIKSGKIKMPHKDYDSHLGMIACTIVGYIEKQKQLIVRFALGNHWGDKGYGYISYEYSQLLINDLWIIEVEIPFISLNNRINNDNNMQSQQYQQQMSNGQYNPYLNQQSQLHSQLHNNYMNFSNAHQQFNPNNNFNNNQNNFNKNKELQDRKKYMLGGMSAV